MNKTIKERLSARFRGRKFFHEFQYRLGNELSPKSWVFILGCYNSGTTLLQDILSTHHEIGVMNDEGVMLTNELPRPEDFGWRRMWWKCQDDMLIDEIESEQIARRIKKQWSHFYPNKPLLLEKSISNVPRIQFFKQHFQPSKFIHIVRNGYAVSEGISRKANVMQPWVNEIGDKYPLEMCATQWVRTLEILEKEKDENTLEVRYEDLTARPNIVLEAICEFLNISAPDGRLDELHFSIHGQTNPIVNMNEDSLGRLSNSDIETIDSIAGYWLDKYGYRIR